MNQKTILKTLNEIRDLMDDDPDGAEIELEQLIEALEDEDEGDGEDADDLDNIVVDISQ